MIKGLVITEIVITNMVTTAMVTTAMVIRAIAIIALVITGIVIIDMVTTTIGKDTKFITTIITSITLVLMRPYNFAVCFNDFINFLVYP